jgi:hypothetical protein
MRPIGPGIVVAAVVISVGVFGTSGTYARTLAPPAATATAEMQRVPSTVVAILPPKETAPPPQERTPPPHRHPPRRPPVPPKRV